MTIPPAGEAIAEGAAGPDEAQSIPDISGSAKPPWARSPMRLGRADSLGTTRSVLSLQQVAFLPGAG